MGVIIIDTSMEMPSHCRECRFRKNLFEDFIECVAQAEKEVITTEEFEKDERPCWCPLRPIVREPGR